MKVVYALLFIVMVACFMTPTHALSCQLDSLQISLSTNRTYWYSNLAVLPNQWFDLQLTVHDPCQGAPTTVSVYHNSQRLLYGNPYVYRGYNFWWGMIFSPHQQGLWSLTVQLTAFGTTITQNINVNVSSAAN